MSQPGFYLPGVNSTLRLGNHGAATITGVTKIGGVPARCRIHLHDAADGLMIGFRLSGADGAYSFPGLAAGEYYLVIMDDRAGGHRAKVEHIALS